MRLEFSFPDKFADLLDIRLHQLRRKRISKSAFLTVAVLKALDVDADLWPRGHRVPKDNGGGPVPTRRPPRPDRDPNPGDDGDCEDSEQDPDRSEVEPAIPDHKPVTERGAPPNPGHEGKCGRCGAVGKVFDSPGDRHEPLCDDCLDAFFWS